MAQIARRRFPYAPGILGWVGAAFTIAGVAGELTSLFLFVWLGLALAALVVFVISLGLFGAAMIAWRLAWKQAGIWRPSSLTPEQRSLAMHDGIIMTVAYVIGFALFAYLFLRLRGSTEHRLMLAAVPIFLSAAISSPFRNRYLKRLNRGPNAFLGLPARYAPAAEVVFSLIGAAAMLCLGLFVSPQ